MIYLDYAATTPIKPEVIDAMTKAQNRFFGNPSALHTPGHLSFNEIEKCRKIIADYIGALPSEIYFTSGSTEGNNTIIRTFSDHEIETSDLEHHSVFESANLLKGHRLPKLYSYMLANNETGDLFDLVQISKKVRSLKPVDDSELFNSSIVTVTDKRGAYLHSDLTQAFGKIPIDVNDLKLDYGTISAHKIGGPTGIGVMYVRTGVPFKPLLIGGNQENGHRAGTYNTASIIGFASAVESAIKQDSFNRYDTSVRLLRDTLARRILNEIPGSSLNTDLNRGKSLPNILNVSFKAAEGESIQLYLDNHGIIVSTGSACASGSITPSHVLMAKTGDAEIAHSSIRFSFGLDNTMDDVDDVMKVLPGIVKQLQGMSTLNS